MGADIVIHVSGDIIGTVKTSPFGILGGPGKKKFFGACIADEVVSFSVKPRLGDKFGPFSGKDRLLTSHIGIERNRSIGLAVPSVKLSKWSVRFWHRLDVAERWPRIRFEGTYILGLPKGDKCGYGVLYARHLELVSFNQLKGFAEYISFSRSYFSMCPLSLVVNVFPGKTLSACNVYNGKKERGLSEGFYEGRVLFKDSCNELLWNLRDSSTGVPFYRILDAQGDILEILKKQ